MVTLHTPFPEWSICTPIYLIPINTSHITFADYNGSACNRCGDISVFCSGGANARRQIVSSGSYSIGGPPNGLERTAQSVCQAGHFCRYGVKHQCGDTFVGMDKCIGPGCYCKYAGQDSPIPVVPGFYSTGGTSYTRTGQEMCPPGHYCNGNGSKILCPCNRHRCKWLTRSTLRHRKRRQHRQRR